MFFFGTKEHAIQGRVIKGITCPKCGKDEHLSFGALRYFHIYRIPMFPTSKAAGIHCLHCKGIYTDEEFPAKIGKKLNRSLFTKRRIFPTFAGLIILLSLLMGGYVATMTDNRKDFVYLRYPHANDCDLVNFVQIFEGEKHYLLIRRHREANTFVMPLSSDDKSYQCDQEIYGKIGPWG